MSKVKFEDVSKSFGDETVLEEVSLELQQGQLHVLFGIPESGKSVILRLLTGLDDPDEGRIYLRGNDVTDTSAGERNISYVAQSYALYPHYTVYENIAYPLRLKDADESFVDEQVQRTAEMLQIDDLVDKYPDTLSGGEKKRVAISRGMVQPAGIYIFDDPLAGLDYKLREQLIDDLRDMQQDLEATFIYSTTEPLESFLLADQIAVLDQHQIIEHGSVDELFWSPKQARTMELLGFPRSNFLSGYIEQQSEDIICRTDLFDFPLEPVDSVNGDIEGETLVGIRPHNLRLHDQDEHDLSYQATITLLEDIGAETIVYLESESLDKLFESVLPSEGSPLLSEGDTVTVGVKPDDILVFDSEHGSRLGQGQVSDHG